MGISPGAKILAEHFAANYTPYVPSWVASAGSVAIGNGILTGGYLQQGKNVKWAFYWQAGSTTTFGTAGAFWTFGLPALGNTARAFAFAVRMLDAATLEYGGVASMDAGASTFTLYKPVSGRIFNNSPFTLGSGDLIWTNGTYELA